MKFATELAVGTKLDIDTLVEAETYEIERLLDCALFFCGRHFRCYSTLDKEERERGGVWGRENWEQEGD